MLRRQIARQTSGSRFIGRTIRWSSSVVNMKEQGEFEAGFHKQSRQKIESARHSCLESLAKYDKTSELLYQYIPDPAKEAFAAIKCFNIEMNRIGSSGLKVASSNDNFSSSDLKFRFWEDILYQVSIRKQLTGGEPIALLLQDSIANGINVDTSYLFKFIESRKTYLDNPVFRSLDEICAYGEGTYSQLNYLIQSILLSPSISPSTISLVESSLEIQSLMSEIAAHIGQATAVATMIAGLSYHARQRNQVTLPVDILAKHDVSQESLLRLFSGHMDVKSNDFKSLSVKLQDAVFETSIVANDHILTSKKKYALLVNEIENVLHDTHDPLLISKSPSWLKKVPDALYIPFMAVFPIQLYLEKLEKNDFNVLEKNLVVKDWKLLWRSYWSYNHRDL